MTDYQPPQNFLLFDKITTAIAKEVVEWVSENNFVEEPHEYLTLIVNSEGGDVTAAFAIIDIMNSSKIPIRTIGMGDVSSSGLMIFMNGEKGTRQLTPNTTILTHTFYHDSEGKFHELGSQWKEHKNVHERMVQHYMNCTGLSRRRINSRLLPPTDTFLTAEQALALGVCDVADLIPF